MLKGSLRPRSHNPCAAEASQGATARCPACWCGPADGCRLRLLWMAVLDHAWPGERGPCPCRAGAGDLMAATHQSCQPIERLYARQRQASLPRIMALSAQSTGQIVHDEGLAAISQTDGWGYATKPRRIGAPVQDVSMAGPVFANMQACKRRQFCRDEIPETLSAYRRCYA